MFHAGVSPKISRSGGDELTGNRAGILVLARLIAVGGSSSFSATLCTVYETVSQTQRDVAETEAFAFGRRFIEIFALCPTKI